MAESGVQNYINTLIFCIVVKGVTILLLILLLFEVGQKFAYLILTVELGLVAIVIISLIQIRGYEKKKLEEAEKAKKLEGQASVCPDYFVKFVSGSNNEVVSCSNVYNTPNGTYTYTIGTQNVNLTDLNEANKTFDKLCETITNTEPSYYVNSFAWTDLKPRCEM